MSDVMPEDLSVSADEYALYLPAVQTNSATRLLPTSPPLRHPMPFGLSPPDFDWLDQENRYWHYRWCLASAGHFFRGGRPNIITERHETSFVLGDSGGYQIATGALAETKDWTRVANDTHAIMDLWHHSKLRHDIQSWLEANCDYAMTLDFPLWLRRREASNSPFHFLSEEQLIELTVGNLEVMQSHRIAGSCKYLNVLQASGVDGCSLASEDRWFAAVKDFKFEGWAFGGDVGVRGGLFRVLRRLLILRDAGLLASPRDWVHLLGVSTPVWAACLSAAQKAIRKYVNPAFRISYDSATAYQAAEVRRDYYEIPNLGRDMAGWIMRPCRMPTGYAYANHEGGETVLTGSPIGRNFTTQDLNPRAGAFDITTTDPLTDAVLVNHNVYVFLRTMIAANEAVFVHDQAPEVIKRVVSFIDSLFSSANWDQQLEEQASALDELFAGGFE